MPTIAIGVFTGSKRDSRAPDLVRPEWLRAVLWPIQWPADRASHCRAPRCEVRFLGLRTPLTAQKKVQKPNAALGSSRKSLLLKSRTAPDARDSEVSLRDLESCTR